MNTDRIIITVLLIALILTSSVSYFGQDNFSAYAKPPHYKKTNHDVQSDSSKNIIKPKIRYHVSK